MRQELATMVNQWKEAENTDKIRRGTFTLARPGQGFQLGEIEGKHQNSSVIS